MRKRSYMLSIERLTEISHLVNKRTENTTGSLPQRTTSLATKRRRYLMELPPLFTQRDPRSHTLRPLLFKRLLKIIKPLAPIFLAHQRTSAKVKLIEDPNSFTESAILLEVISGMQVDASTESPPPARSYLITTSENL